MKKYKLKAEVRKLFDAKFHTSIEPITWWNDRFISIEILDEVSAVFVKQGRQTSENTRHLSQYDRDGAVFDFTVCAPELTNTEYNNVDIPKLMDIIQKELDKYFKQKYC